MPLKLNSASGSVTLTPEDGSGNVDVTVPRSGIVSDLSDLSITATASEINTLDGITATVAELNYVDGVTSNIQTQLDAKGTVSTLADLSVTATATELNILDGATLTTAELNYVDGVTSAIQTQLDAKGTVSSLSDLSITATASELNTLDGITATVTELNYVDGVTSNIQTQLDQKVESLSDLSITSTAAELNILDGATLTTTELNYVDGVTSAIQTQIDTKAPTASPTFTGSITGANLTLSGDLTVNGTTTTVNSTNTVVSDGLLELGNGTTGTPANDTGIVIERGDSDNAFIGFDESADKFIVGTGSFTGASTGNLTVSTGTLVANVEGNVTGNADTATALATGRTISLTGDVTGTSGSFDGSGNVSITATIADDSHNHVISNVDGLQTALDAKADLNSPTFTDDIIVDNNSGEGSVRVEGSTNAKLTLISANTGTNYIYLGDTDSFSSGWIRYDHSLDELTLKSVNNINLTSGGVNSVDVTSDGLSFPDNRKAKFGNGDDLSIYSDGTNSIIAENNASGNFIIRGANVNFQNAAGTETFAVFTDNGSASLFHNNSNKLQTTSSGVNISGKMTSTSAVINGFLDIEEVFEKVNTNTTTSGTYSEAVTNGGVYYLTNAQTANRTINLTGVNSALATGQSVTVSVLATQGSTAYYFNAYQVDSSAVTPKWSGGSAPSAGNASGIDVYTFTIIKTADATFTVLASVTQYA